MSVTSDQALLVNDQGAFYSSDKQATALSDLLQGILSVHIWGTLGWHDIRQRYRRSVLGPFWFTLSTALLVVVLGFLYAKLLNQEISEYLPFLASGLVVWGFIATTANESCTAFSSVEYLIKQVRLPLSVHVCRVVWRNLLILAHNVPVLLIVLFVLDGSPDWSLLLVPFGLLALAVNGVWMGVALAILCTRFRDIPPVVQNIFQLAFFVTPVMWMPELLQDRGWVAGFNPFYHSIEVLRAPLIGRPVTVESWLWVGGILVVGAAAAVLLTRRYRARVPYWL